MPDQVASRWIALRWKRWCQLRADVGTALQQPLKLVVICRDSREVEKRKKRRRPFEGAEGHQGAKPAEGRFRRATALQ